MLTEFIQLLFNDYVICNIEQKGFNSFILGETKFPGLNIEAKFQKFWGFTEVHFILEPWGFELNHQKSFGFCDQISWFLSCAKILTFKTLKSQVGQILMHLWRALCLTVRIKCLNFHLQAVSRDIPFNNRPMGCITNALQLKTHNYNHLNNSHSHRFNLKLSE